MGGKDSCALIAGASSGMFHEYAKLFTKDGKDTVVQAISRDKHEGLKTE
jgi:NADP-dependent 3-hydroxy acid dehydrogenase YdfG